MATAGDQITRSLRLIGAVEEGETPTPALAEDCLIALNQMIDSWNTERLSVFTTQDQVFTWPAGKAYRTLGAGTTSFTGTISGTTLTVTVVSSGLLAQNMTLTGTGVTADTRVVSQLTGSQWDVGTYQLSVASTVASPTALAGSADFVGVRPIQLDDSSYFRDSASGISYNLTQITEAQYQGIALKTVTSTYPQLLWTEMSFPYAGLTVYPVPTQALEFHLVSVKALEQAPVLATTLYFPPGYLRAFTYNLAVEIAPELGFEPSPTVARIAMASKRNLKRINNPGDMLSMPIGVRSRFNIYAGV